MQATVQVDVDCEKVSTAQDEVGLYGTIAPPPDAPVEVGGVFVVLLDTSRTMSDPRPALLQVNPELPNRITTMRNAIEGLIKNELSDDDIFSLVVFDTEGYPYLTSDVATSAKRQEWLEIIEEYDFDCGGRTNLESGVACAVEQLKFAADLGRGTATLMILCDGDVNLGAGFAQSQRSSRRRASYKELVESIEAMLFDELPTMSVKVSCCGVGPDYNDTLLTHIANKCGDGGFCEPLVVAEEQAFLAEEVLKMALVESRHTVKLDSVELTIEAPDGVALKPIHPLPESYEEAEHQGRGSEVCYELEAGRRYKIVVGRHTKHKVVEFKMTALLEAIDNPDPAFCVARLDSVPPGANANLVVKREVGGRRRPKPKIQERAKACEMRHDTARELGESAAKPDEEQFENAAATEQRLEAMGGGVNFAKNRAAHIDETAATQLANIATVVAKASKEVKKIREEVAQAEQQHEDGGLSSQEARQFGFRIGTTLTTLAGVLWTQTPSARSIAYDPRVNINMTQEERTVLQRELDELRNQQQVSGFQGWNAEDVFRCQERLERLEELTSLFRLPRASLRQRVSRRFSRSS